MKITSRFESCSINSIRLFKQKMFAAVQARMCTLWLTLLFNKMSHTARCDSNKFEAHDHDHMHDHHPRGMQLQLEFDSMPLDTCTCTGSGVVITSLYGYPYICRFMVCTPYVMCIGTASRTALCDVIREKNAADKDAGMAIVQKEDVEE